MFNPAFLEFNGQVSQGFALVIIYKIEMKSLCTRHSLLLHFYVAVAGILRSNSEMPQKNKSSNGF